MFLNITMNKCKDETAIAILEGSEIDEQLIKTSHEANTIHFDIYVAVLYALIIIGYTNLMTYIL